MSVIRPFLLSSIILIVLLGGCNSNSEETASTVTDDQNRTVQLDRPIERVVSLAPSVTELVYAAGGGETLAAVTTSDDYPPAVDTLPRVSALPVDFEAISAHNPDLVLATDQINAPGDADTFEALEIPIYFFSFSSLDDILEGIRTMGRLLGTEAAARDSARSLQRELDSLRAQTESIPRDERPRVLVLVGDETLYSFGRGSYIHTLVELAGGRSITQDFETQTPTLSEEYVLTEKPDVIIGAWGEGYDPSRLLELHPTWDVVPAVRNDRVYSLPSGLLLRPTPRVLEGARRMMNLLHPMRDSSVSSARGTVHSSRGPGPSGARLSSRATMRAEAQIGETPSWRCDPSPVRSSPEGGPYGETAQGDKSASLFTPFRHPVREGREDS